MEGGEGGRKGRRESLRGKEKEGGREGGRKRKVSREGGREGENNFNTVSVQTCRIWRRQLGHNISEKCWKSFSYKTLHTPHIIIIIYTTYIHLEALCIYIHVHVQCY